MLAFWNGVILKTLTEIDGQENNITDVSTEILNAPDIPDSNVSLFVSYTSTSKVD